ncbi:MAG: HAD-IA family hydrolase [Bryobacterales bacterium]|nr:HAD-IA family hydrolase [Bryobacterales bacterium]
MRSLLIFDLDGTLIDSKLDLANSVNAARIHMGMPPIENDTVYSYVGNGAPVLMRKAMGTAATEPQVQEALAYFLGYYREHMLENTRLYPGVKRALDELKESGYPMAVLTNKPVRFSRELVAGLGMTDHFFQVYGGNSFEQKKPHPIGVDELLKESGAARETAWMIGDSAVDIKTARNANIKACGVTYGFQPETLLADPPDLLLDTLEDLPKHVK